MNLNFIQQQITGYSFHTNDKKVMEKFIDVVGFDNEQARFQSLCRAPYVCYVEDIGLNSQNPRLEKALLLARVLDITIERVRPEK